MQMISIGMRERQEMLDNVIRDNFLSSQLRQAIEFEEEKIDTADVDVFHLGKLTAAAYTVNHRLNNTLSFWGMGLN